MKFYLEITGIVKAVGGWRGSVVYFQDIDHGYAMVFSASCSYEKFHDAIPAGPSGRIRRYMSELWIPAYLEFYRSYRLGAAAFETPATRVMMQ